MCGRFYIDDDTAREIERTIRKVDEQMRQERKVTDAGAGRGLPEECRAGGTGVRDVHPTELATVISKEQKRMVAAAQRWGFPGFGKQKVIINARAETVLEKKMFRDSVLKRRIVIPAAGFYEWNRSKEKVIFTDGTTSALYLAGFFGRFEGEDRFIILTTSANDSMKDVHDRMPLILEEEDLEGWLWDDRRLEGLLHKEPRQLRKKMEYEQQKLIMV